MTVIDLPFATPSLNEIMDWKHNPKTRRWKYKAHKEEVRQALDKELRWADHNGAVRPRWQSMESRAVRMRVVFTRYSAGTLDDDNLVGGFKPTRDVLKDLGVIADDTAEWLLAEYRQEKAKRGEQRTRLEIEAA